jgi:hypothetical protein
LLTTQIRQHVAQENPLAAKRFYSIHDFLVKWIEQERENKKITALASRQCECVSTDVREVDGKLVA